MSGLSVDRIDALSKVELPPLPQSGQLGNDQNYLSFKRVLEQSHYKQPLGVETVPLVYSMFADYVALCKHHQQVAAQVDVQAVELTQAQNQLFPLRRENTRLVRANNAVHLQAMKVLPAV